MRLFIAINFDGATKSALQEVQGRLRQAAGQGRFTRPEYLHLTLAFLGETPPGRLGGVRRAMDRVRIRPMRIVFDHTGVFRQDGGDLWWVGLRRDPALLGLQRALSKSLAQEGFQLPQTGFLPHLTLARQVPPGAVAQEGSLLPAPVVAPVDGFSLMLSERVHGVLAYTELYIRR